MVKVLTKTKNLPLSGSEPLYTERRWGSKKGIEHDNCYDYAFGNYSPYRTQKSSPGNRSGNNNNFNAIRSCGNLPSRVISDNPSKVYKVKAEKVCRPGFYKTMMFVAPAGKNLFNTGDFHFYKQHGRVEYKPKKGDTYEKIAKFFGVPENRIRRAGAIVPGKTIRFNANIFSHKRGWATGPLMVDSKGKIIKDPRKAGRNYTGLNYSEYCSSFCVKNKGVVIGKNSSNVRKKGLNVNSVFKF
ncbi:hypothetical protein [Dishui Lake phycodnavirus 4]|nr:hypothetical protein [Dishui Lake phycodnavirus 4]